jgi:hypothetical protein
MREWATVRAIKLENMSMKFWFGLVCFLEPKLRNFVILVLVIKQGQRPENIPNFSRLKKPVQTRCRESIFTAEN